MTMITARKKTIEKGKNYTTAENSKDGQGEIYSVV